MPSIEILAVGQADPEVLTAECGALPFAVEIDPGSRSHRARSRFQSDFDRRPGVLYHLGNPDLKAPDAKGAYFAYDLLGEEAKGGDGPLEFSPEYRAGIEELLDLLLRLPGVERLLFTTDWQFGPAWTRRGEEITLGEFWRRHAAGELSLNCLYPIVRV